jgi:hypothetical protein
MNLASHRLPAGRRAESARLIPAGQLLWSHLGRRYRVTAWPEVQFEQQAADSRWFAIEPTEEIYASAAIELNASLWRRYLEFVPVRERQFLQLFTFGRLAALRVLTAVPELLPDLLETPALVAFIAAHGRLRGTSDSHWAEVRAVVERGGVYLLLEWLGLPASRDTLAALRNLLAPDVPQRLLAPLRASLWSPQTRYALQRTPAVSDRQLATYCEALAA